MAETAEKDDEPAETFVQMALPGLVQRRDRRTRPVFGLAEATAIVFMVALGIGGVAALRSNGGIGYKLQAAVSALYGIALASGFVAPVLINSPWAWRDPKQVLTTRMGFLLCAGVFISSDVRKGFVSLVQVSMWAAGMMLMALALYLFTLRLRYRAAYGVTEIGAGVAIGVRLVDIELPSSVHELETKVGIALLTASLYLIVRGLDNLHQGLNAKEPDPSAVVLARWWTSIQTRVARR